MATALEWLEATQFHFLAGQICKVIPDDCEIRLAIWAMAEAMLLLIPDDVLPQYVMAEFTLAVRSLLPVLSQASKDVTVAENPAALN